MVEFSKNEIEKCGYLGWGGIKFDPSLIPYTKINPSVLNVKKKRVQRYLENIVYLIKA